MPQTKLQRATPYIMPIATSGGTLFTFSSAAEDLTLSSNSDSNRKFKFSKFALLDIPNFINDNPQQNSIKLGAMQSYFEHDSEYYGAGALNNTFTECFQDYCLNLETMILSSDNYDSSLPQTVSERVFFKWLKELSALQFNKVQLSSINNAVRFTEEKDNKANLQNNYDYSRVVKYLGEIDFVNNLSTQANSYQEVYVHVPTEVGSFPNVYFKSVQDANYYPSLTFSRTLDGADNEYIYGRTSSDNPSPVGLDIKAWYDNDVNNASHLFKRKLTSTAYDLADDYINQSWWYRLTSDTNAYYLEPDIFDDATTDDLAITRTDSLTTDLSRFRRSRLDGITLDFDPATYGKDYLLESAQDSLAKDFEFNCVLLYYDVYEDVYSTGSPNDVYYDSFFDEWLPVTSSNTVVSQNILATNLFGVLFLDNVEDNSAPGMGGYIPRFKKVRPNVAEKLNGNSFGFKINLKLDVSPINSGVSVQTVISDSNTLSMDIYASALNDMKQIVEAMQDITFNSLAVDTRLFLIEDFAKTFDKTKINSLQSQLDSLSSIVSSSINFTNSNSYKDLVALINTVQTKLDNLISNKSTITVSYDLNQFTEGKGIKFDYSVPNKLGINSVGDYYSFQTNPEVSIFSNFIVDQIKNNKFFVANLYDGRNYLRITDDTVDPVSSDIVLKIDDTMGWEIGQTFRIYFKYPILLSTQKDSFKFSVITDSKNRRKTNLPYSVEILRLTSAEFSKYGNKPCIEIICVDPYNFKFFVDIFN